MATPHPRGEAALAARREATRAEWFTYHPEAVEADWRAYVRQVRPDLSEDPVERLGMLVERLLVSGRYSL
jgi:hypothetical protein